MNEPEPHTPTHRIRRRVRRKPLAAAEASSNSSPGMPLGRDRDPE
jgi:hypothetical protein